MTKRFEKFTARFVLLPRNDIDTDQIIPARFLKTTTKNGLDAHLFADWRYDATGAPRADFVLNLPASKGAEVLVAGENFGCGSSREHAPWALVGFGFRAVVALSFADIFKNNALKNGLLPIAVPAEIHARILSSKESSTTMTIDLETQTLTLAEGVACEFAIDAFAKRCLAEGVDELGYLLSHEKEIAAHERKHQARG